MKKRGLAEGSSESDPKPSRKRLSDAMSYPPRAMRVEQAAAYLAMGKTIFLGLVRAETMPPPVKI